MTIKREHWPVKTTRLPTYRIKLFLFYSKNFDNLLAIAKSICSKNYTEIPIIFPQEFPLEFTQIFPLEFTDEFQQEFPSEFHQEYPHEFPHEFPQKFTQKFPHEFPQEFPQDVFTIVDGRIRIKSLWKWWKPTFNLKSPLK